MTIEYIRYDLKTHAPETFLAAYEEAAKSLAAAPECLAYEMTRCEEDAKSFILRIHWASTHAHLEGFRKGPNFPPFLAAIRDFMPEIAEMRHYEETPLVWARAGEGLALSTDARMDRRHIKLSSIFRSADSFSRTIIPAYSRQTPVIPAHPSLYPGDAKPTEDAPMPMPAAEIDRLIKAGIPDADVEIIDLAGDDNHFSAIVTSSAFAGLSKLKQHQLVYKALGAHMGGALHALQLQTLTPKA